MSEVCTNLGVVRPSADSLGVGLYSADDAYRYWFLTQVAPRRRPGDAEAAAQHGLPIPSSRTLTWVGLNPSRSDDNGKPRPSLGNVLRWAEREGFSEVLGVNLYAYRHTDPHSIKQGLRTGELDAMIGEHNESVLHHVAERSHHVLLAWGTPGALGGRGSHVAALFSGAHCIGRCANGEPAHPARKSPALEFQLYS